MSDDNRANDNDRETAPADEDRLPWLEAVEEDGDRGGPSVAKLVAALFIGLIAIGVIVGGLYWLGNRGPAGDGNDIITAERGDYKERPQNPGGMNLSGEGNTSVAASEGQQPRGTLDVNGVAEAPAAPGRPPAQGQQPGQPARPGQQAQGPAQPQQPARPAPAPQQPAQQPQRPAPAASGPAIQLGAFSTPAAANTAWRALAARFRYLAPLTHSVQAAQSGGRTVHRLRASGPDSANVCRRLQAAGEACAIVN
ncbi:MAG TPA: SPOR domain-containing protein [Allosphingosinicella sp.]|nr:SPOR domain-containing protein [Allosphingosinicella sp.]